MSIPPGDESMLECPIQDPDISSTVPVSGVSNPVKQYLNNLSLTQMIIVKFTENRHKCQYFCHGCHIYIFIIFKYLYYYHNYKHIELTIQHFKSSTAVNVVQ